MAKAPTGTDNGARESSVAKTPAAAHRRARKGGVAKAPVGSGGGAPGAGVTPARAALVVFVLLLVILAFARAHYASSTGIRITGDGTDYENMAAAMRLEGRAPFVYRPAVPLLVGALFGGDLTLGFGVICALSMFTALFLAGFLADDALAGFGLSAVLFFNYQVLFAAANVARLDVTVLAVQLLFVALALKRRPSLYFALLPLCALLKESMLLGLGVLAISAFPRERATAVKAAASGIAFIAVHAAVRAVAEPTAAVPPYDQGLTSVEALFGMLSANVNAMTPLQIFVAWSGLAFIALWVSFGGDSRPFDPVLPLLSVGLLLFPLPLATDVHRAWFELLAPLVLFLVLRRLTPPERSSTYPALALALAASVIPYAVRFVAEGHLHLALAQERLSAWALAGLATSLITAAAALGYWMSAGSPSGSLEPIERKIGPQPDDLEEAGDKLV